VPLVERADALFIDHRRKHFGEGMAAAAQSAGAAPTFDTRLFKIRLPLTYFVCGPQMGRKISNTRESRLQKTT